MMLTRIHGYLLAGVFIIFSVTPFFPGDTGVVCHQGEVVEVALYASISPSVRLLADCFNYSWGGDETGYRFHVTLVDRGDILSEDRGLTTAQYDVLVIGASGRQYFHALQPAWRRQVIQFLGDGGGYVGICGGANVASQGMEHPDSLLARIINLGALRIVNVHINDDQGEEWQYLWKDTGEDHIPVPVDLPVTSHPLFQGYGSPETYITYGGGPGMYPADNPDSRLGNLVPLATFHEEPSSVAPLHYWRWQPGGWVIHRPVMTDIKDQYAVVSTVYNNVSRVVLFSPHPEIPPMFNGSLEEFFGVSIYGIPRYVYQWDGGIQTKMEYNWWMVRRAVAWAAHVPPGNLPPLPPHER